MIRNPQGGGLTRRDVLKSTVAAGAAMLSPSIVRAGAEPRVPPPARPGGVRFAHLTDMHVQPERRGGEGYAAALRSLHSLNPGPEFIITGGDHVMDVFRQDAARARVVWDLYQQTLSEHWDRPVYPVIGNHDVWAWGRQQRAVAEDTPGYGKAMSLERLKLQRPYSSFDAGGWHFVCLDNIARRDFNYFGSLDEEQAEWFARDLESAGGRPVCVTTHIPLVAACVLLHETRFDPESNHYRTSDRLMHRNVAPLVDLMRRHNVKLCLSGHIHLIDRVELRGITFICDGAVSGAWWKGPYLEFAEGYGVIDVYPDGRFDHQYVTFDWAADPG
jgi:3',5'-cyclic-AMP phosphodiesterase